MKLLGSLETMKLFGSLKKSNRWDHLKGSLENVMGGITWKIVWDGIGWSRPNHRITLNTYDYLKLWDHDHLQKLDHYIYIQVV